ncbi:MAG: hypothetical protein KGL18_09600 [Burkholderiales bacterium]|nr:hypothetical protein [Burkholderiales bacterium]MDE1928527.1 hypothetical protein [Burkholderiales bacterium]MDE2161304.1 hypothetical protein [Burkholderiales bacterium]MDE2503213.1 hypothetical protein [Burkholderiales bacterium]
MAGLSWSEQKRRPRAGRIALLACLLLLGVPARAAEQLIAGPDGTPMTLDEAVHRAADGDTIELLPGQYRSPIVIANRHLTLRGMGDKPPVMQGDDKIGSAQALWTVRGGDVTIENVEFRGARSAEGSGAGVRMEGGHLHIVHCTFFDNEHGLYALNDAQAELDIRASVFGMAPKVVGGLYHLLNVGRIARLSITGSRFQQGFEGHLIKSRAREATIAYNLINDGMHGGASYEIDLANGGMATVIGNVIGEGVDRQNPVLVAYGSEGRHWDRNELYLVHNTMINQSWMPAWFVRVFSEPFPAGVKVYAVNNLIVGPGLFWFGFSGETAGNRPASIGMLRDAPTGAYELAPGSIWRDSGVDPHHVGGRDLAPNAEFEWPTGTVPIGPGRTRWTPGAYQR